MRKTERGSILQRRRSRAPSSEGDGAGPHPTAESDLYYFALGFDGVELVQLALAAAGADAAGVFPILGCFEVGIPERPGAALAGAGRIDRAAAGFGVEEDAVAVRELIQALAGTDPADVLVLESLHVHADDGSDRGDFFVVHPDRARRAGAAVAALGAGEAEAGVIPGKIGHWGGFGIQGSGFRVQSSTKYNVRGE
jgi:hypothetical protein